MRAEQLLLSAGVLIGGSGPAIAEVSIGDLGAAAEITIVGRVAEVFGNRFVLEDAPGRVLVDAGPEWHRRYDLRPGEYLRVVGEMDGGSFEAFRITRSDGTILEIRPSDGPPPWAGGPVRDADR
jgi:hypothetical protein